jgi:2-polyprenyl-3-methyl-5-hydroxy-6-metoxy-1,4-benzoquinol methylase
MELEKINCPLCGSKEQKLLFKSKDFRLKAQQERFGVVRCQKCLFIFLNPRPRQVDIAGFYPSAFYKEKDLAYNKAFDVFLRMNQNSVIGFLQDRKPSGRLLDIGAGTGLFLERMESRGYDVYGVEISENAKDHFSTSLKPKIYDRNLEECGFKESSFDIITMFQSLEHVHNFDGLLKEARRILKPDGIMYLTVPNADFCEYRIFGPYAYTLEVPRHLYFFTKQSLRNLLLKNGFIVDRFRRNIMSEFFLAPASVYHGIWNFLTDKYRLTGRALKSISFAPLLMLGALLHMACISEGHVLEVSCRKEPL